MSALVFEKCSTDILSSLCRLELLSQGKSVSSSLLKPFLPSRSSWTEKKNAEPITEDKKAEQKNDENKSPAKWKVKMRKRKQREKIADLSDQLRKARKIVKVLKQKPEGQRQHVDLDHFEEKRSGRRLQTQRRGDFQNEDKGLFSERSSWVASSPSTRL